MVYAKTQAAAQQAVAQEQIPTKFFPLLRYIGKATIKVFRQQFKSMVFFGVLGWLLHTWLVVFINGGFNQNSWGVGAFLATNGIFSANSVYGTVIWMIGSGLLFSWLGQKLFGPKGVKPPKQPSFGELFREASELALAAMAATAGISFIIGIFALGWTNTALALGIGATMLTAGGSVIGLLVSSAWSSTYGLQQSEKTRKFSMTTGKVAMAGSVAAFLVGTLPFMTLWVKVILGLACLGGAFYLTHRQGKSAMTMLLTILSSIFFISFIAYLFNHAMPVFADDGAWVEGGGNFGSWIQSEGAAQAMGQGILPGLGAAIGPAIYQVLISMGINLNLPGGGVAVSGTTPVVPQTPAPLKDENGNEMLTWDPEQYGPGDNGQDGKPGWVWHNGNWVDPAKAKAEIDKINPEANMPHQPEVKMVDEDGQPIITWQPGKYGPDTKGNSGGPGKVWHWGEWVTPEQARQEVQQDLTRQAQDQAESERLTREWRARNAEQQAKDRAEGARQIAEADARRAQEAAQTKADEAMTKHILEKLKGTEEAYDAVQAARNGDLEGLKEIYKEKLGVDMTQSQKDAAYYDKMATLYGAGEVTAKLIVAGSKAGLIAVGGPAGIGLTAGLTGTISAAQEGTQSYVNGDSAGEIFAHTVGGFLSGAKDGAVGVYTQLPGIGTGAKYLIPAGADTAETFIRATINDPSNIAENMEKALGAGALSIGSSYIGNRIDSSGAGGLVKEGLNLGAGAAGGAAGAYMQGGDPGEGALEGLIGAAGSRIGGAAGTKASDHIRTESETPVKIAIGEANQAKQQEIGVEGQSQKIQDLNKTKHQGDDGKTYVDEGGALDQLRDTQSSRTAKQAPDDVKDPIINTRQEKIYKPADNATISKAENNPEIKAMMQPGDKLKMDQFSTPGKPTSLGADRDARLVIERPDPENPGKTVKIEVPREHWENDAYKDFYDHTTKLAGGKEAITPENYPGYHKRVEEMTHNNPEGLTKDQIEHRAWAEEHNQLFTDKNHVEASRDNSDQLTKFLGGKEVQTQGKSNVELVQKGDARMLDPEGYAQMWKEKSDVYSRMGNQPEAVAQSQKGIQEYMKIRDGYDKQGLNVAPIDPQTAKAMDIISKAPVGVDATPQKMAEVNQHLQQLGFKDTNDALGKVAMQNETLGFATTKGISSANTTRISVSGIEPPEPAQPQDGAIY